MSTDTFRDLYLEIAGEEVLTDTQEDGPSHEPIRETETELERAVADVARHDGLTDAVAGAEKTDQSL